MSITRIELTETLSGNVVKELMPWLDRYKTPGGASTPTLVGQIKRYIDAGELDKRLESYGKKFGVVLYRPKMKSIGERVFIRMERGMTLMSRVVGGQDTIIEDEEGDRVVQYPKLFDARLEVPIFDWINLHWLFAKPVDLGLGD